MLAQVVLQVVHAKRGFHAVADSPAEHPPGVPVVAADHGLRHRAQRRETVSVQLYFDGFL
jgi:hypothetical protein